MGCTQDGICIVLFSEIHDLCYSAERIGIYGVAQVRKGFALQFVSIAFNIVSNRDTNLMNREIVITHDEYGK